MEPLSPQAAGAWNGQPSTPFPPPTGIPHFAFTEAFEGGAVFTGISAGRGKFVAVEKIAPAPCLVFTVVKDRLKGTISVNVQSGSLRRSIANALGTYLGPGTSHPPDLHTLLRNYDPLKQHLEFLQLCSPGNFETQEFRLLAEDFLLDRAVYEGLRLEQSDRPYVLSQAQLRDLHECSLDTGLDALDDCFRLGTIHFDMGDDDVNALTRRYSQIALSGHVATPNRLPGSKKRPRNLAVPPQDPVFSPGGADPEPPGSYQSFSNLAHRIKRPQTEAPLPHTFDLLASQPPTVFDSVNRLFKAGSPFRLNQAHERSSDDSAVGLSSGGYTSLSALENISTPLGLGDAAPLLRARSSSFHTGIGPIDPAFRMPLNLGSSESVPSRSKGRPGKDMNFLGWETESEPMVFGARADSSLTATSLPVTAFHNTPSGGQTHGLGIPTKEKQSPHLLRQQLGRNLIASLTQLCKTVRDAMGISQASSPESLLSSHFSSFMGVWNGGVRVFRQIIDNHPPRNLLEVLDCLVVASAMCTAITSYKDQDDLSVYFEFIDDMGRWKSVLDPAEHPLFDRVAHALWLSVSFGDPMPEREDKENLNRFHQQIQDLVSLKKEHPRAPARSVPYATRLDAIQRQYASKEDEQSLGQAASAPVSIPIPGGGARKRVFDESLDKEPDLEDDFSISDVFDVDRFLAQSVGDGVGEEAADLGWNDILSTTVLLLASTAFSAFLTLATIILRDFDAESILAVWRRPRGYPRACDVLSHFIESVGGRQGTFRDVPLYRERSLDQGIKRLSLSTMSAPSAGHMWPPSAWADQAPGSLRMRARASVAPSAQYGGGMDLSHSLGAVPRPDPRRLRCLSAGCLKTFSSVSNRNKHMREGCQHGEKARFRCRNGGCSQVLSTKWYRNTHETERCKYRGVVGEKG